MRVRVRARVRAMKAEATPGTDGRNTTETSATQFLNAQSPTLVKEWGSEREVSLLQAYNAE